MAPTPAPDDPPGDAVPLVDEAPVDEPPAAPRPRLRRRAPRLVTVLGIITALVLVDLAIGAGMTATGFVPHDRGDTRRDIEHAVGTTMAAPGIAGEPWAGEYRDSLIEYELGGSTYEPYLVREPRAYSSRYLNTTAAERLSYTPRTSAGTDPVRIAFFGGSVMFGVGQRDEHTIPSALARLAEDAGVPVEVHNYGLPGWVAWQEIQYFERLLAAGEQYDLVVFYDGFNEFLVQHTGFSEDPTHVGSATLEQLAVEYNDLHKTEPDTFDGLAEVGAAYRRASGVARLYDRFRDEDPRGEGELQAPATPEQQADAALDVYERARRVATDLATGHGTSIHFFWQPTKAGWEPSVIDRLPDDVTDVSHVLDGREDDVYIDEVHTNEAGATLVAEALWADLAPEVERAAGGRAP